MSKLRRLRSRGGSSRALSGLGMRLDTVGGGMPTLTPGPRARGTPARLAGAGGFIRPGGSKADINGTGAADSGNGGSDGSPGRPTQSRDSPLGRRESDGSNEASGIADDDVERLAGSTRAALRSSQAFAVPSPARTAGTAIGQINFDSDDDDDDDDADGGGGGPGAAGGLSQGRPRSLLKRRAAASRAPAGGGYSMAAARTPSGGGYSMAVRGIQRLEGPLLQPGFLKDVKTLDADFDKVVSKGRLGGLGFLGGGNKLRLTPHTPASGAEGDGTPGSGTPSSPGTPDIARRFRDGANLLGGGASSQFVGRAAGRGRGRGKLGQKGSGAAAARPPLAARIGIDTPESASPDDRESDGPPSSTRGASTTGFGGGGFGVGGLRLGARRGRGRGRGGVRRGSATEVATASAALLSPSPARPGTFQFTIDVAASGPTGMLQPGARHRRGVLAKRRAEAAARRKAAAAPASPMTPDSERLPVSFEEEAPAMSQAFGTIGRKAPKAKAEVTPPTPAGGTSLEGSEGQHATVSVGASGSRGEVPSDAAPAAGIDEGTAPNLREAEEKQRSPQRLLFGMPVEVAEAAIEEEEEEDGDDEGVSGVVAGGADDSTGYYDQSGNWIATTQWDGEGLDEVNEGYDEYGGYWGADGNYYTQGDDGEWQLGGYTARYAADEAAAAPGAEVPEVTADAAAYGSAEADDDDEYAEAAAAMGDATWSQAGGETARTVGDPAADLDPVTHMETEVSTPDEPLSEVERRVMEEMGSTVPELRACDACEANKSHAAHFAAYFGHLACLEVLVERTEAFAEVSDSKGRTALFYAAARNHPNCVALLVDVRSGWIDAGDANGDTALHVAACRGHDDVVQLLLESGAAATRANKHGLTATHVARTNRCLMMLWEYGGDLLAIDANGRTPLFTMCATGRLSSATCLCELDEDMTSLSLADKRGDTPLHAAACNGHLGCLQLLLEYATPVTTNSLGLTPIKLAKLNGHKPLVDFIRSFGGDAVVGDHGTPVVQSSMPIQHVPQQMTPNMTPANPGGVAAFAAPEKQVEVGELPSEQVDVTSKQNDATDAADNMMVDDTSNRAPGVELAGDVGDADEAEHSSTTAFDSETAESLDARPKTAPAAAGTPEVPSIPRRQGFVSEETEPAAGEGSTASTAADGGETAAGGFALDDVGRLVANAIVAETHSSDLNSGRPATAGASTSGPHPPARPVGVVTQGLQDVPERLAGSPFQAARRMSIRRKEAEAMAAVTTGDAVVVNVDTSVGPQIGPEGAGDAAVGAVVAGVPPGTAPGVATGGADHAGAGEDDAAKRKSKGKGKGKGKSRGKGRSKGKSKSKKPTWTRHVDKKTGLEFYHNRVTGASTWKRPADYDAAADGGSRSKGRSGKKTRSDKSGDSKGGGARKATEDAAAAGDDAQTVHHMRPLLTRQQKAGAGTPPKTPARSPVVVADRRLSITGSQVRMESPASGGRRGSGAGGRRASATITPVRHASVKLDPAAMWSKHLDEVRGKVVYRNELTGETRDDPP